MPSLKHNGLTMISMAHGGLVLDEFDIDLARGSEADHFAHFLKATTCTRRGPMYIGVPKETAQARSVSHRARREGEADQAGLPGSLGRRRR